MTIEGTVTEFASSIDYHSNRNGPLRYALSHIFRYKFIFFSALILMLVSVVLQSSIPSIIGNLAGLGKDHKLTLSIIKSESLKVLIIGTLAGLLLLIRNFMIEYISQNIEKNVRDELYSAMIGKSLAFHDQQTIGDLMARAAADVRQLNFMLSPGFVLVAQAAISVAIPFIFIALIDPILLIVPTLFLITFLFALQRYNAKLTPLAWSQRMIVSKINSRLNEAISGMQLVRGNTQEKYEKQLFTNNIGKFKDIAIDVGRTQAKYYPLLLLGIATALALLHGIFLVTAGTISFGELISYMLLIQLLRFPTFINIFAITVLSMGIASSERIISVIEGDTEIDLNASGKADTIRGDIEFRNVIFGYNKKIPILNQISFHAHPGETIALVGMTGSGKTTITKLLARLYDPQHGQILVDGVDIRDWSIHALRSQMALVEQDIFLFSRSIKENIRLSNPSATDEEIINAAKLAKIHDFIMTLEEGYDTEIGERGVTLSGGQRQRVAIARAVIRNPAILVLDDASSAIDSKTEDEINHAISNVLSDRVAFIITHRIAQIRKANQIILIDKGKIIASGSHEELVQTSEEYSMIFSTLDTEEMN